MCSLWRRPTLCYLIVATASNSVVSLAGALSGMTRTGPLCRIRSVHPQRPLWAKRRPVEGLAGTMCSRFDGPAYGFDPGAARLVDEPGVVKNGQGTNIRRPADLVGPQHDQVLHGQAFHDLTQILFDAESSRATAGLLAAAG